MVGPQNQDRSGVAGPGTSSVPLFIHALAVDDGGWLATSSCPAWGGSRFLMDG